MKALVFVLLAVMMFGSLIISIGCAKKQFVEEEAIAEAVKQSIIYINPPNVEVKYFHPENKSEISEEEYFKYLEEIERIDNE